MSRRARILIVLAMTLLGALSWSTGPYWTSFVQPESGRGQRARKRVERDTPGEFAFRAVLGAAAGGAAGLLGFTVRDRKRR